MPEFQTAVDIGNRALQHIGQRQMSAALGFAEPSQNAAEVSFCYGKLREAELHRNNWRFAIKEAILRPIDTTTMLLVPAMWVVSTTYFRGSIVADESGNLWISNTPSNLGNDPLNSSLWDPYFGPMTVSLYDATGTTTYYAGELVYTATGDGTNRVYLSLITGNADVPSTATPWLATTTFYRNQVVTRTAVAYMSLTDFNINQDPATTYVAPWAVGTTYSAAQVVTGSDGVEYSSVGNGNLGHDPTADDGTNWTNTGILSPWTRTFVGGTGSLNWLQVGGAEFPSGVTLAVPNIIYPIGSGPVSQSWSRNIFRLPANYLRKAPRDPKRGSVSLFGAPSNLEYDDWDFESDYIVSVQADPLRLRFVANVVDVTRMDPMFCEGLAARIAQAVCEKLTQSTEKKQLATQAYKTVMTEARQVNAIEVGSEEPALDDWIATRA